MGVYENLTLQDLLKKKDIRQTKLAELLNIHESTVSLKISGKRKISLEEAKIIADSLDTTTEVILSALNFAKRKVANNLLNNQKEAS